MILNLLSLFILILKSDTDISNLDQEDLDVNLDFAESQVIANIAFLSFMH
jgi:hypothetical protein